MSKRIVTMPFTGNPYLLSLWVKLYLNRWHNEANVIVLVNGDNMDTDTRCYCESLLEYAGIQYIFTPIRINHGPAIDIMLTIAKERGAEYIGLVEEDAFIFEPTQVDHAFKLLESKAYDVVAGRRGSCSKWLIDIGKVLWGTEDHGPNFWPNFFFSHIDTLLQTDRDFGAHTWDPGSLVFKNTISYDDKEVQDDLTNSYFTEVFWLEEGEGTFKQQFFRARELTVGDTFVKTSLQIRENVEPGRICLLPQYHCVPEDLDNYDNPPPYEHVFDGKCPWIHVGSLSSWYSLLMENTLAPDPGAAKAEWERRVAFFKLFHEVELLLPNASFSLDDFEYTYTEGIQRMIFQYELNRDNIDRRVSIYRKLLGV